MPADTTDDEQQVQEAQYDYPYHYTPGQMTDISHNFSTGPGVCTIWAGCRLSSVNWNRGCSTR